MRENTQTPTLAAANRAMAALKDQGDALRQELAKLRRDLSV